MRSIVPISSAANVDMALVDWGIAWRQLTKPELLCPLKSRHDSVLASRGIEVRQRLHDKQSESEALFAEALKYIPAGVNSPVRAFRAVGGQPFFVNRAKGAHVFDLDGNEFVDYVGTWGPAILGHAYPGIIWPSSAPPKMAQASAYPIRSK